MTTKLATWLADRGEKPRMFALRLGMNAQSIYALCGLRSAQPRAFFKTSTLEKISIETGIPVRRLYSDWAEVEPVPSRVGRPPGRATGRKSAGGGGDGVAAE